MKRLYADFDRTFKALEDGLQVEHIAEFDLKICQPNDPVAAILDNPKLGAYDQFPVCNNRGIIGVLERQSAACHSNGPTLVEEAMVPLDSSMLASNSQPVASILDALQPAHYRLVVRGSDIEGIVTASDLLKLPVRLYAFMLVTHLELLMAASIRGRFRNQPAEEWMSLLSEGRRSKICHKIADFSNRKLDPDPIELTDFCDKREILRQFHATPQQFVRDMRDAEELRNSLAHAANYLNNQDDLDTFLRRVRVTRSNIDELQHQLRSSVS